jgi:hypothetical protein
MPVLKNAKHERYYVYALMDDRDNSAFYIGKGCGRRAWQHMHAWRKGTERNYAKTARISEIMAAGGTVSVNILVENLTETKALRLEREIIREFGIKNLTNIQPGSMSEWDRAILQTKDALSRFKPFDVWMAERPRSTNCIIMYHAIKGEFQEMLGFFVERASHGKA